MEKKNAIKEKSFQFALAIIQLYKFLVEEKKEFVLSRQLLRSGTSIGANIREANNAESKGDFIHKMGIAQKECDETLYWIELLTDSGILKVQDTESIYDKANELLKIIRSIILTAKHNMMNVEK